MAVIIQQPNSLSMSGNMKKFIISSGSPVSFLLKEGDTALLESSYVPGEDGRVTVDLKDIVESRLTFLLSHDGMYEQTGIVKTFTAEIDETTTVTFRVIRAGVADLQDTVSNWLRTNFLTWQHTNKRVTYYSPEWLTYYATQACNVKLKAYFPDDTVQNVNLGACEAGKAFTFNMQYARIAGLLGQTYPTCYDVWVESGGTRLTYVQRYLYSEKLSEQEQWFVFENSLGGVDTVRAYGETDFTGEHAHKLAETDNSLSEYHVDSKRFYNKNTGHLNKYERRWMLDFFPSRKKYIYFNSSLRPIVVTDSDVKYQASDLPSSYNFTYRFSDDTAALLNLIRNEDEIPAAITIPDISSPDFHLPPRLVEYPRVQLHEGVILPAFDPNSETPSVTTVGAVLAAAIAMVVDVIQAGEAGGELVDVLRVNDSGDPSDFNVFSAARALIEISKVVQEVGSEKFLSKVNQDTAQKLITFLEGIELGEFVAGMSTGKGGKIDASGNAELTSLRLRELLEVPELRYNRLTLVGDEICIGAGGLILKSEKQADDSYLLHMKLEDGEMIPFLVDDILKGIYNQSGGFYTSWMRVVNVDQSAGQMLVVMGADEAVPSGRNYPPADFMNLAKRGNFTNASRQSSIFLDAKTGKIMMLDGVDNYTGGIVSFQLGKPAGLEGVVDMNSLPINPDDSYAYVRGLIAQDFFKVDYQGKPIKEIRDRGQWSAEVASQDPYRCTPTLQDDVWTPHGRYRCIVDLTTKEPKFGSTDWVQISGDPTVSIDLISESGTEVFNTGYQDTLMAVVKRGSEDITTYINPADWEWKRTTSDTVGDTNWNVAHADSTSTIDITFEDFGNNIFEDRKCTFTVYAFVRALGQQLQMDINYEGI